MSSSLQFIYRFKVYLLNTSWIMAEKIFTMGVSFFIIVLLARYLGPERYGILAYALSMTGLFATAGHMGLGGLVVREIVKKPDDSGKIMGTSLVLKFFGFVIGFITLLSYAFVYEERQGEVFWVLIIVASSLFFRSFDVVDYWFQAHVQAKFTAIARSISLMITACFNAAIMLAGGNLLFFAFSAPLQSLMGCCLLMLFFRVTADLSIASWRVDINKVNELLSQGWVIFLGAIFATIYLKVDQIMLKWFVGAEEVGFYAVAASLSESWYFVPTAIVASIFPQLIKLRTSNFEHYQYRLQQIFDLLFLVALAVAIIMTFMATPIINVFFGDQYKASASILVIHIWAALFIFMRAAFSKWILIEDALIFSLITQGFGALANVALNLLLIPKYGGRGAAVATLLSYAMASYFSLMFYRRSRPIFWMMSKAMLSPIKYPLVYLGKKW